MKKLFCGFLLFLLLFSAVFPDNHQRIEFNASVSANFYNLKFSHPLFFVPVHEPRLSYGFGAGTKIHLIHQLYLGIDAIYKVKKSELVEFSGMEWADMYYRLRYLSFPVTIQYRIPVSNIVLFADIGFEPHFLMNSQVKDEKNDIIIESIMSTNNFDVQILLGGGIRYKFVSLTARYGWGLQNLNQGVIEYGLGPDIMKVRNRGFECILSFYFNMPF
jgi:hypothetical protein